MKSFLKRTSLFCQIRRNSITESKYNVRCWTIKDIAQQHQIWQLMWYYYKRFCYEGNIKHNSDWLVLFACHICFYECLFTPADSKTKHTESASLPDVPSDWGGGGRRPEYMFSHLTWDLLTRWVCSLYPKIICYMHEIEKKHFFCKELCCIWIYNEM